MSEMPEALKSELTVDETIALFKRGKDVWNKFMEENLDVDISFEGYDFRGVRRTSSNGTLSFADYVFPGGKVNFQSVNFGKGDVSFEKAMFCAGKEVSFSQSDFSSGYISFRNCKFGTRAINFEQVKFTDCNVDFQACEMGDGNTRFLDCEFTGGKVLFIFSNLGSGEFLVQLCKFGGPVILKTAHGSQWAKAFSFKLSSFEGPLDISRVKFASVPDLTFTSITGHVGLERVEYTFHREGMWPFRVASYVNDIARLNRLKEIAERNSHHSFALICHADEMRARRWRQRSIAESVIDIIFSAISNYGRSIIRPMAVLVFLTFLFFNLYKDLAKVQEDTSDLFVMTFTLSNAIPFVPSSLETRKIGLEKLFEREICKDEKDGLAYSDGVECYSAKELAMGYMWTQGVLSFMFLFLIGLALRNIFRI